MCFGYLSPITFLAKFKDQKNSSLGSLGGFASRDVDKMHSHLGGYVERVI